MSGYILRELGKVLEKPTRREVLDRIGARPVRELRRAAAEVIRDARTAR